MTVNPEFWCSPCNQKFASFYWNQSKSKLKIDRNKVNQNKQPNQFIYVQDNPETKIKKNKVWELNHELVSSLPPL